MPYDKQKEQEVFDFLFEAIYGPEPDVYIEPYTDPAHNPELTRYYLARDSSYGWFMMGKYNFPEEKRLPVMTWGELGYLTSQAFYIPDTE